MTFDKLLASLLSALGQNPQDQTLRLHIAELLLDAGRPAEALARLTEVLTADPGDAVAIVLLQRAATALAGSQTASDAPAPSTAATPDPELSQVSPVSEQLPLSPLTQRPQALPEPHPLTPPAPATSSQTPPTAPTIESSDQASPNPASPNPASRNPPTPASAQPPAVPDRPGLAAAPSVPTTQPGPPTTQPGAAGTSPGPPTTPPDGPANSPDPQPAVEYDWSAAEHDLGSISHPFAQPAFVDDTGAGLPGSPDLLSDYEVERPTLRLSDVGGMQEVKARLDVTFLTPMRNPALRQAFGKSLRGGLMLYGPPGCGKTFLARALAGELGARFASVSLADVLDMWVGSSERNVHQLFAAAREAAPCVVFLDEIDALGHKRSQMRGSAQRGSVNQLLTELDGVGSQNDGVFVLAASNTPWDVDPALRRPGRLDRTLLVLPPDDEARSAILRSQLSQRPVTRIDVGKLVKQTERFSGADLVHLVETAAERALTASVRSGSIEPITMRDLSAALGEVRPSTAAWFETARNVAEFANEHGEYDDLLAYLRRHRML